MVAEQPHFWKHHPTVFRMNEVSSPFVDLLRSEDILLVNLLMTGRPQASGRPPASGIHVLPYMGFKGMCGSEGYGFQTIYSGIR